MEEQRKINMFATKSIDLKYLLPFEQVVILFDILILASGILILFFINAI